MLKKFIIIASLPAALAGTAAHAADLTVLCNVKQVVDGKTQPQFQRRYEIDLEPRYFRTSVDTGKGFRGEEEGFPKDVNNTRIVFVDDGKISQFYDRTTGEYAYKDVERNVEAIGRCIERTGKGK